MQRSIETQRIGGRAASAFRTLLTCVAACAIFGILAGFSIEHSRASGRIAALWLPNALAVAVLLRFDIRGEKTLFSALACGNLIANFYAGDGPGQALVLTLANMVEIALAVFLTRRWCGPRPMMEDISTLRIFAFAAAICAPAASAVIAASMLSLGGIGWLSAFTRWVISDALGMLILAPSAMIVVDAFRGRRRPTRAEVADWVLLTFTGTSLTIAVFAQTQYPLLFLIPPVVVAHAFRLGSLGTAFSIIKVAVIALVFTEFGYGPINLLPYPLTTQLMVLESFLASAIAVGLPFAAILSTRDRMTGEIEEQREELSLLTENITDAILRYDAAGICIYASPSTESVLGLPPESFVGKRASARVHEDAETPISEIERKLLSGESDSERFTYRRFLDGEQGQPIYIEAYCAVARNRDTGKSEGIVVSARDVTKRVVLENNLKLATKHAENAARAKAQFLANMSHEIRTPMNGVLGFAELLRRLPLEGEAPRYAELIERSGRSMMVLLNDILDLSKIESGQLAVCMENVEPQLLAAECVELHQAHAQQKNVTLKLIVDDDVPSHLSSDPLRLRQILLNLIGNAVKFTERGVVEVLLLREGDNLAISVEDTGIGIDPDRLEQIFEPFVQQENSTTRRFGGTGLGLSISRQLAELLGGTLAVESMPGIGSRFTVRIPIGNIDEAPARVTEAASALSSPKRGRILVAEDHDINRIVVVDMLRQLGQVVDSANDGNEAVSMALDAWEDGHGYDLMLMDIQMPGCDGYTATRRIRSADVTESDLPIIALTAHAYPEDIAAAKIAGMQSHLAKPLVFEDLAGTVERWLSPSGHGKRTGAAFDLQTGPSPQLRDRWLKRRGEAIDAVSNAVREGAMEGLAVEDLARIVHKLAGSAGMFGEEELGHRAAALERALRTDVTADVRKQLAEELLEAA